MDKVMRTRYILLAVAALAAACSKSGELPEPEGLQMTFRAYQEGAQPTRTTVQEGGTQVFWEPGDEIKVFSGSRDGRFTSNATGLTDVTEFTGTLNNPEDENIGDGLTWGLYPYRDDATFDGSSVTTTLPSEQTGRAGSFARDTHITLARSSTQDLAFYNVCGGVRFTLSQEGISRVTFEGNNGETLAGQVRLAFKGGVPIILEVIEGETSLTLTAPDGGTFETGKWYYFEALPESLDEGFRMTFYKGNETASLSRSGSVKISRGKYGSLADVDSGLAFAVEADNLFPAVIPLDDGSIAGYVVNESQRTCSISFSNQVPNIKSGSVVCLPPKNGDNGIFLVTSASVNGNTVDMHWQRGDLSYVFCNTSFTVSTHDATSAYAPRRVSRVRKASQPYDWELWRGDYSGTFNVLNTDNVSLTSSFSLTSGIDAEFTFDFYGVVSSVIDGIKFLKSRDFTTNFKLLGTLNCHSDFSLKVSKESTIDLAPGVEDKEELVKHNFLPPKDFLFPIGPITIPVHLGCDLYHEVRAEVSGELELAASVDLTCHGETGFSYDGHDSSKPFQPIKGFGVEVTKHNPTLSGWGEVSGTYYVIPRFYAWVAYAAGPALEIRPFAKTTLTGAFQKDLVESSTDDFLSASFKASVGAEWAVGISTPLENYFYEASRTMKNLGIIKEFDVAKSPVAIELASASSDKVYKDTYTTLNFSVLADYYGVRSVSYLPSIVKIEVPATGISTYKYTWNGEVDYSWTPSSDDEILYAKIFDKEGKIIDQVQFGDGKNDDEDEPDDPIGGTVGEAIDLGLSVKWASWNVGASKPEEYGDYFAWGETETKSYYLWSTYKWCNGSYDTLTKYNTDSSYGTVDNKTVLDPEDDAAHVNWGGSWRMPTDGEWEELKALCTWTWTTQNGVNGRNVTGPNGNSIFLPAAGFRYDSYLYDAGSGGGYLSSSLYTGYPFYAWYIYFLSGDVGRYYINRYFGFSVRPVSE